EPCKKKNLEILGGNTQQMWIEDLDYFFESWDERTLLIDESVDDIVGRKRPLLIGSVDDVENFHDLYEDIEEVPHYFKKIMRTLIKRSKNNKVKKNVISDYFTPVIFNVDSEVSSVDQPQSK
ncbi:9301_t:CDS:2, partial [Funneliformis mosseae]